MAVEGAEMERVERNGIEEKAKEIARLLPDVLRRGRARNGSDPLSRLLGAMALLQERPESVLDALETFYDPERAPLDSLVYLAYWMDLEPLIAPRQPPGLAWKQGAEWPQVVRDNVPTGDGLERLRALVGGAVALLKERSTPQGLERVLETATGVPDIAVTESREQPFHIEIACPAKAKPYKDFVERIVELQKPAYSTYDLNFDR